MNTRGIDDAGAAICAPQKDLKEEAPVKRLMSFFFVLGIFSVIIRMNGQELIMPLAENGKVVVDKVQVDPPRLQVMQWAKFGETLFGRKKVFYISPIKLIGYKTILYIEEGDYIQVPHKEKSDGYFEKKVSKSTRSELWLAESQRAPLPDTHTVPYAGDLKKINDSTVLKLLLLDISSNLIYLDWQERERQGIGKTVIMGAIRKIAVRYNIPDPTNPGTVADLPECDVQGAVDKYGIRISVSFSGGWYEYLHFENPGNLPPVKYYNAHLTLYLKSMTVTYGEGTRVMLEDRQYISEGGKLVHIKKAPK